MTIAEILRDFPDAADDELVIMYRRGDEYYTLKVAGVSRIFDEIDGEYVPRLVIEGR